MDIRINWTELKAIFNQDSLSMQYREVESTSLGTIYTIWIVEPGIVRYVQINDSEHSADITDFETSYKSLAGKRIASRQVIADGDNHDQMAQVTTASELLTISKNFREERKTSVAQYGQTTISSGVTLTLTTYTVPVNKKFYLTGGFVGGEESAEFTFEVAGSDVALIRNSGADRTRDVEFKEYPEAIGSEIINIKAKNVSNKIKNFEATLFGYTLDI